MKNCITCGKNLEDNAQYCDVCGQPQFEETSKKRKRKVSAPLIIISVVFIVILVIFIPPAIKFNAEKNNRVCSIDIVSGHIIKDHNDYILILKYDFKNESGKDKSFSTTFMPTVFQNGIECERAYMIDEVDTENQLKKIQTGHSIIIDVAYKLQDTETPVDVKITKFATNEVYSEQTINLNNK